MITLRQIVPALCLATALSGIDRLRGQTTDADPGDDRCTRRRITGATDITAALGEMGFVLHKLNLSAEQKTQIKSIFAGAKEPVRGAARQLQVESRGARDDPADRRPAYPALDPDGADQCRDPHHAR